ncbi:ATP-binding protein [Kitasatospora sp. McL0602]|uniref:ATP-binding protein n=1 Tax=Kitasatospora sp. McL0602 TaxID=3439530 RepID=UPI003F8CE798
MYAIATPLAEASAGPILPRQAQVSHVWRLPHRPESAGVARRVTHAALGAWGVGGDTVEQAVLVVSELVTNAVEHALPPVALHLSRPLPGGTLHIEVDDGGPAPQEGAWASSCAPEERGRGNTIVAMVAATHGHRPLPGGAAHWADLATG